MGLEAVAPRVSSQAVAGQLRREQRQSLSPIHQELAGEAEELARRKDRLSAHQDLEERRLREDWE